MEGTAHRSAHEEPTILTLRKVYRDGLRPDRVGVLLALRAFRAPAAPAKGYGSQTIARRIRSRLSRRGGSAR